MLSCTEALSARPHGTLKWYSCLYRIAHMGTVPGALGFSFLIFGLCSLGKTLGPNSPRGGPMARVEEKSLAYLRAGKAATVYSG